MKTFKRILFGLLAIIVIALIAGLIFVRHISHKGLPVYSGTLDLKSIKEEVTIIRDEYAIPHIYAKNEEDLYTAVGYAMAQDRLWQMDLLRRVTTGRLSEIFGEELVETDLLMRAFRFPDKSKKYMLTMDSIQLMVVNSFCNGVNAYIENAGNELPIEFTILGYKPEPFDALSCINLVGYMAWDQSLGWNDIIYDNVHTNVGDSLYQELIPGNAVNKTRVYPSYTRDSLILPLQTSLLQADKILKDLGLHVFFGSNNWAVSDKRSTTGKPILCNDMHMTLNIPGIWYQMHQVIPGKLDVSGVVVPGQPYVISGHNQRISWGITNLMADNIDLYEEKINDSDSLQYLYNEEWKKMEIRKEIILIKGGEKVERENRFTHRGPVVSGFKGINQKVITMHWAGDEMSNEAQAYYLINRAGNWKDFTNAVSKIKQLSSNIVFADIEGNIGMHCVGGIPIRNRDNNFRILPGWTDKYDWKGFVPFENLPYSYNPEKGYVSSANNKTAGDDYPYHIGTWFCLPSRIDRIREMIEQKPAVSLEDMKVMQNDQHSVLERNMNKKVVEILSSASNLNNSEKMGYDILKNWNDGSMDKNLVAPAVFESFYIKLPDNLLSDEIDSAAYSNFLGIWTIELSIANIWSNPNSAWWDDIKTKKKETMTDIVRKTLGNSIDGLITKYGADTTNWKWGNMHKFILEHPLGKVKMLDRVFKLNRGPFSIGGSNYTISPYNSGFKENFISAFGSSQRHIYSIADWDSSYTVIPTGNSGISSSEFYCDQTELYVNGQYHNEYFSEENVKKHEKFKLILK